MRYMFLEKLIRSLAGNFKIGNKYSVINKRDFFLSIFEKILFFLIFLIPYILVIKSDSFFYPTIDIKGFLFMLLTEIAFLL